MSYLNRTRNSFTDYSRNFINIDTLCDVLSETQREENIKPTFELKDKYKTIEKDVKKEEPQKPETTKPKDCPLPEKYMKYAALLGVSSDDDDDEEDELYVCELCDAIGSCQKYDSGLCDSCTTCESCNQFLNDECSGCGYSVYRDGRYYRDKVSESELIGSDDLEAFEMIKSGVSKKRLCMERFSVLK